LIQGLLNVVSAIEDSLLETRVREGRGQMKPAVQEDKWLKFLKEQW
jgi:hypothetical protein